MESTQNHTASRARTLARGILATVLIALLVTGGYVIARYFTIERFELDGPEQIEAQTGATTWALVASDSRAEAPDHEDFRDEFQQESERADLIYLVKAEADADGETTHLLAVPRDMMVPYQNHEERLNLMLTKSPARLAEGICDATNVAVNAMAILSMNGAIEAVDDLGGVEVELPHSLRGAVFEDGQILQAGAQTLNGRDALALVRFRKGEELIDGEWVEIGSDEGALGRIHQSDMVFDAILDELSSTKNPFTWLDLYFTGTEHVRLSEDADPFELLELLDGELQLHTLDTEVIDDAGLEREVTEEGWAQLRQLGFIEENNREQGTEDSCPQTSAVNVSSGASVP